MITLRVSNTSKAYSVATSIAENIKTYGVVQVLSIGAASTYEANKAMIHAKGLLASAGLRMICMPSFIDVEIDDTKNAEIVYEDNAETKANSNKEDSSLSNKKIRTAVKWTIKAIPEEY
jgi:stage V sporulation protein S